MSDRSGNQDSVSGFDGTLVGLFVAVVVVAFVGSVVVVVLIAAVIGLALSWVADLIGNTTWWRERQMKQATALATGEIKAAEAETIAAMRSRTDAAKARLREVARQGQSRVAGWQGGLPE